MSKSDGLKSLYAFALATQLGFLIVFSIVGFMVGGLWLDKIFDTKPWFLIVGIIVGILTAVIESYQLIEPIIHPNDDASAPE